MKKVLLCAVAWLLIVSLGRGIGLAGDLNGKHYNLNIIGFAQCDMQSPKYTGDCFNGNSGDIVTAGHTIFVPLRTDWIENPCLTSDGSYYGDQDAIQVAELQKGVRILVSDGDDMMVVDRDATDGLARFTLPDGQWQVMARPLGKPGGCMDIDTVICEDLLEISPGVFELVQVDCDPNLANDNFVLVGHLDVDRSKHKPQWKNATDQLLPEIVGVGNGDPSYLDFFWQLFNNNLRLLQLRFYYLGPAQ